MKSPLKNGLFAKRWPLNHALRLIDFFLRIIHFRFREPPSIPSHPKKILLSNLAHFGDVVIATTVLPILSSRFPGVKIAFLGGSKVAPLVLEHHPLISKIHTYDHWVFELKKGARRSIFHQCKAALHHFIQKRAFLRELRRV